MHLKLAMRALIKTTSFKLTVVALGLIIAGYIVHSNESMNSKAKRITFPGITHVRFDRSMKNLNLEKVDTSVSPTLITNLNDRQLKMTSALFADKANGLMVVIAENTTDERLVFAVIKNNQVTQIQKINEITNKKIALQYGQIILNSQMATAAATYDASSAL